MGKIFNCHFNLFYNKINHGKVKYNFNSKLKNYLSRFDKFDNEPIELQELDPYKGKSTTYRPPVFKKDFFDTLITKKKSDLAEPLMIQEKEKEQVYLKPVNIKRIISSTI
jgi:hypothetical protein